MVLAKKAIVVAAASAFVASVVALSGCAGAEVGVSSDESFKRIDQTEAMEMMESETDFVILDVRTEAEFAEGHIPGAVNVPVESIGGEPPSQLPDKDQLIMVYCRSGNRSVTASEKLVDLGYTNIVEFGGINTWPGEVVAD